jgi:hypothetical protein
MVQEERPLLHFKNHFHRFHYWDYSLIVDMEVGFYDPAHAWLDILPSRGSTFPDYDDLLVKRNLLNAGQIKEVLHEPVIRDGDIKPAAILMAGFRKLRSQVKHADIGSGTQRVGYHSHIRIRLRFAIPGSIISKHKRNQDSESDDEN